jgi:hypothetical protein
VTNSRGEAGGRSGADPTAGTQTGNGLLGVAGVGTGRPGQRDQKASQSGGQPPGQQPPNGQEGRSRPRLPPVRLAPRDELASAARVAPLLRAAAALSRWAGQHGARYGLKYDPSGTAGLAALSPKATHAASEAVELTPEEASAAWRVVQCAGMSVDQVLGSDEPEAVLKIWDDALAAILDTEELDGLATALYTVGGPVKIDALFDAYAGAAGGGQSGPVEPGSRPVRAGADEASALSAALETLADLGVVELDADDAAGGLTVELSPLGIWGVHRRLRAQGWHVPVLGGASRDGAVGLLVTLAGCDAEDGEAEITSWLTSRTDGQAAAELISAAAGGSPGLRGAAFAVLDRIGPAATEVVRGALTAPQLRAHAAVWLHEHGEEAELRPEDRTWLLVDLGVGLLEEADPRDVVAELLPEVPSDAQAEIVAGLWQVQHPGVIGLLTALSDFHPDPAVARAARKASFKARSPGAAR